MWSAIHKKTSLSVSKGSAINKLGTASRKQIEGFIDKKVFLDLFVKVRDGWRNNELDLKRFGYKG
jgi:GTP-binding protein Era